MRARVYRHIYARVLRVFLADDGPKSVDIYLYVHTRDNNNENNCPFS